MSNDVNPYQPQVSGQLGEFSGAGRPAVATVFGILNLVFGILGICSNIAGSIGTFVLGSGVLGPKVMEEAKELKQFTEPIFFGFMMMQMVLGIILSVVIITSGVGLLKFKPWGLKLANFYAITTLILVFVGTLFSIFYTILPAINEANRVGLTPQEASQATAQAVSGAAGGAFGLCFAIIYPICILAFLNRKQFVNRINGR